MTDDLQQIEAHFQQLIVARAASGGLTVDPPLPVLAGLRATKRKPAWFTVPGMYGGFAYWLEGRGTERKLITESWCRVVSGSGQRHEITPEGAALVEEGFV